MEEAIAKVEEKQPGEEVSFINLIITTTTIIMIIEISISQSKDVSECTPRYIGHDIDSEMASKLRMLCLVVLLLRCLLSPSSARVPSAKWSFR